MLLGDLTRERFEYAFRGYNVSFNPELIVRAVHESGHALAATLLGQDVHLVTIRPEGKVRGRCEFGLSPQPPTDEKTRRMWAGALMVIAMASHQAELQLQSNVYRQGHVFSDGDQADVERVLKVGNFPDPVKAFAWAKHEAWKMVEDHRMDLDNLASSLLVNGTMTQPYILKAMPKAATKLANLKAKYTRDTDRLERMRQPTYQMSLDTSRGYVMANR